MQKRKCNVLRFAVVGIALCLCIFIACENDTDSNSETGNETESTRVRFNNLEQYQVTVYRDSLRQNVFAEVAALGSTVVSAEPSASGTVFYPTFNLELFDIPGIGVPYNAPGIVTTIAEGKTTDVPIPKLETININSAFIKVINNSSSSLTLRQGGTEINLLGANYGIVAPNQSAVYEVAPGLVSGYSLMRNTTIPISFPADITEFKRGIIYVFTYNGTSLPLTQIKSSSASIGIVVPGSDLSAKLAWLKAYAESNHFYTVEINTDESIASQTLSYSGKNGVTITMRGIGEMRTINLSANGSLFIIDYGVTLILDNNITLNGRSGNDRSLVMIDIGGTMIMNEGTKITGNTTTTSSYNDSSYHSYASGGGVDVYGGTFTMNGGTISDNTALALSDHDSYASGGGVYVSGTFTMNGGTISDNTATSRSNNFRADSNASGGGVYVSGTFTMNGGTISGNAAYAIADYNRYARGGGVSGSLTMSGGVIYGNNAETDLGNTASQEGAALYGGGQYGTFIGDTFYPSGNLTTTDTTIRIVNGNLLTE